MSEISFEFREELEGAPSRLPCGLPHVRGSLPTIIESVHADGSAAIVVDQQNRRQKLAPGEGCYRRPARGPGGTPHIRRSLSVIIESIYTNRSAAPIVDQQHRRRREEPVPAQSGYCRPARGPGGRPHIRRSLAASIENIHTDRAADCIVDKHVLRIKLNSRLACGGRRLSGISAPSRSHSVGLTRSDGHPEYGAMPQKGCPDDREGEGAAAT